MCKIFSVFLFSFSLVVHPMEQSSSELWNQLVQIVEKIKPVSSAQGDVPEHIEKLRNERAVLEKKLVRDWNSLEVEALASPPLQLVMCGGRFLQYIYYEKLQCLEALSLFCNLETDTSLVKKCLDFHLDGYSALGIAVICGKNFGHEKSLEPKKKQIKRLIELGFKPTLKDLDFSYLELYERTPEDSCRKLQLLFLTDKYEERREDGLPSLSLDIIKNIARYIRSEEPLLLPEN